MLAKQNRIRKKKDFDFVFKKGASLKGSFFLTKIAKNKLGISRFGFIVSGKVSKKAVERNKIKRRASESVRRNFERIRNGLDVVFIALPKARTADYKDIEGDILNLLKKQNV